MVSTKNKLLLTPKDFEPSFKEWKIRGVFNPGAIRLKNNKILLLVRVAEKAGHSHGKKLICPVFTSREDFELKYKKLHEKNKRIGAWNRFYLKDGACNLPTISHLKKVLLSEDGFTIEKIYNEPAFFGTEDDGEYGVEDPRIVKIGNEYYMTYVSISRFNGVSTSLAKSKDFGNWNREGLIFSEQNKDCVLFPEKIGGKYVALHRPEGFFDFRKPSIWISYSPDLIYWGREKSIMQPRPNSWDSERIGAGPPPIRTDKGWLLIYHGVSKKGRAIVYSVGAALLDLKDPSKIIARSPKNRPLIFPKENYEKKGYIRNVIFPTGIVQTLDKEWVLIYSGGADRVVSVHKLKIKDIINHL